MKTIGNRIREIKEFYYGTERGSNKKFAEFMEETPQVVSNWFSRGDGVSSGVINKILERFPDIDRGWLIGGNGEMLTATKASETAIGSAGAAIGQGLASSVAGLDIGKAIGAGVACAAAPFNIGGLFGSLFSSLFSPDDDVTEEEAVEVLKEALEDHKRISEENEELKSEVEYWRSKANSLEYQLSKTKAG